MNAETAHGEPGERGRFPRGAALLDRVSDRYFILTLAVFVSIGVPAYFYLAGAIQRQFMSNYTDFATATASEVFARHLDGVPEGKYVAPLSGTELDSFLARVEREAATRDLVKIKVWRDDGMLLYATGGQGIGEVRTSGSDFAQLLANGAVSEIEEDHPEVPGERSSGEVLEIYLPVQDRDGQLANVIEVYYSVARLDREITAMRWTLLVFLGALFIVVAGIGQLGGRLLVERNRQLRAYGREIERVAVTDALTGVANRRRFHERLQEALATAERHQRPLSLVMVDLDFFKAVNDHYGHQTGDRVLQETAGALTGATRSIDFVARYGGEEFTVIMPDTSEAEAVSVACRLLQAVQLAMVEAGDARIRVTASFGVAEYGSAGRDEASLISAADSALYLAKNTGRNRVCSFSEIAGNAAESVDPAGLLHRLRHAESFTVQALAAAASASGMGPAQVRILHLAREAARALDLSDQDHKLLELAASLYGANRPSAVGESTREPLSLQEAEAIRTQPELTGQILAVVDELEGALRVVRLQQEFQGVELGAGGSVSERTAPNLVRVLDVIEAYVVLTTGRSGGPTKTHDQAVAEIVSHAGTRFDLAIVERLLDSVLREAPFEEVA